MRDWKTGPYEMRPLSEYRVTSITPPLLITINGVEYRVVNFTGSINIHGDWATSNYSVKASASSKD